MSPSPKKIAVIGAGIAGLTCAYELQKAGHQVIVYEKGGQVGGRMSSRSTSNYIFDLGADHLCEWYFEMKKYCAEFGIEWEKMRFRGYGIVKDKKIISQDQATGIWGKIRLAVQYFRTPSVDEDFFNLSNFTAYDDEDGYEFMRRTCGQTVADYLVDSFCTTYQFHRAKEISKGTVFAIIHSLKTHIENWELHRTQGGMQALPNAFAQKLNVQLNHPVIKVESHQDRCLVDGAVFDQVVLATTASVSQKILSTPTASQSALLSKARYAASISVAFKVPKNLLPQLAIVWVPFVESNKISGYVNEAMKGEETTQNNEALLCTWLHEDYARTIMNLSNEGIFNQVKAELLKICPWFTQTDQLQNYDLQKWPEAMPKFYAGYLKAVKDFLDNHQGDNNIYLCGDYMNSLWTEGALRGGQRTAEQMTEKLRIIN